MRGSELNCEKMTHQLWTVGASQKIGVNKLKTNLR